MSSTGSSNSTLADSSRQASSVADRPAPMRRHWPVHLNRAHWLLLIIVLLAVWTRWTGIARPSYWYDEFCSLEASTGRGLVHFQMPRNVILSSPGNPTSLKDAPPVWQIWTHMDQDVHPPLYFIILRFWRDIFGSSELTTRSLSALAGILGVLCIYDVGKLAHGRSAGLWAAAIFALAGSQVYMSQDARGYTLVVLLGLCAADAIVRMQLHGANRRRLLALGASALAMMLTHYLAVPLAAAMGLYLLIAARGRWRWNALAVLCAAGLVFAISWGPFFWRQLPNVGAGEQGFLYGAWNPLYAIKHLAALPLELIGYPVQREIQNTWPAIIIYLLPLLLIRRQPFLALWLFWLLGTAIFLGAWDQLAHSQHLSYARYILICGPGFYLILAGLLSDQRKFLPHLLPALAVFFALVSLPNIRTQRHWPNWRQAASVVDNQTQPNDLIVFASDGKHDWFSGQYMSYAFYAQRPLHNVLKLTHRAGDTLLREMAKFDTITLVNGTNRPPTDSLPGYRVVRVRSMMPFFMIYRMDKAEHPVGPHAIMNP